MVEGGGIARGGPVGGKGGGAVVGEVTGDWIESSRLGSLACALRASLWGAAEAISVS